MAGAKPTLTIYVALLCAALLTSCVSPQLAAVLTFPRPQLAGSDVLSLTDKDVREIAALPWGRNDIRKPVYQIYTEGPDRADVSSGRPMKSGDKITGFKVRKLNGRWIIIKDSIYEGRAIITS